MMRFLKQLFKCKLQLTPEQKKEQELQVELLQIAVSYLPKEPMALKIFPDVKLKP